MPTAYNADFTKQLKRDHIIYDLKQLEQCPMPLVEMTSIVSVTIATPTVQEPRIRKKPAEPMTGDTGELVLSLSCLQRQAHDYRSVRVVHRLQRRWRVFNGAGDDEGLHRVLPDHSAGSWSGTRRSSQRPPLRVI